MDIKNTTTILLTAGFLSLLSVTCNKNIERGCKKMGYEYAYTQSLCWYSPVCDSIPIGSSIILTASVPKTFIDESTQSLVTNPCQIINGPLHVTMIYPFLQASVDSFELTTQIGKVIKDTMNFTAGQLRGFRTVEWNGNSVDSFKIKIAIKALAKGVYIIALGQQGYRDVDCALYKYFLNVGSEQHLYYLSQYNNGYIGNYERNFGYCFKVY
jgi:hypothetical protein